MKSIVIRLLLCCSLLGPAAVAECQPQPTYRWVASDSPQRFNFHPAVLLRGDSLVVDSLPYATAYTVLTAYRLPDSAADYPVWRLCYDSGAVSHNAAVRGLTTQRLLLGTASLRYDDGHAEGPIVNTLQQAAPAVPGDSLVRLVLGGAHAAAPGRGIQLAELFYFTGKPAHADLRRAQSYMAMKYGVTLGPVDYLDGAGRRVWSHRSHAAYHHRITALGSDSSYGLHQLRSRSQGAGSLLTLAVDSLSQGQYLVAGDDAGPLVMRDELDHWLLPRRWCLQRSNPAGAPFAPLSLTLDTTLVEGPCDSLILLVAGTPYYPYRSDGEGLHYRGILVEGDSAQLTFLRSGTLWHIAKSLPAAVAAPEGAGDALQITLYPNPTEGPYQVEVRGAAAATVLLYDAHGTLLSTRRLAAVDGLLHCTGTLPGAGIYFLVVVANGHRHSYKLIAR